MTRTFNLSPAKRERTPLLVGLVGPSSSGKTYSALRLAAGFQRVDGKMIAVIDTEARRALHYDSLVKFQHMPFAAPFGSLDYLAAIDVCAKAGAGTIIIDSMSHEHEGPGGVLEEHDRLMGGDLKRSMTAWIQPKKDRRALINAMLQMPINFVFCYRAKEKVKVIQGKPPVPLGWQAIAGEEFIYENVLNCLLLPGANGVPTWQAEEPAERAVIKLPEQFRAMFKSNPQLSEDIGEKLARWAAGDTVSAPVVPGKDGSAAPSASAGDTARVTPSGGDSGSVPTVDVSTKVLEGLDATTDDVTLSEWIVGKRATIKQLGGKPKRDVWAALVAQCERLGMSPDFASARLT